TLPAGDAAEGPRGVRKRSGPRPLPETRPAVIRFGDLPSGRSEGSVRGILDPVLSGRLVRVVVVEADRPADDRPDVGVALTQQVHGRGRLGVHGVAVLVVLAHEDVVRVRLDLAVALGTERPGQVLRIGTVLEVDVVVVVPDVPF